MNYGMYLSAAGIVANSYRQDVISNNIANSETTGFKRDLATFYARPTEAQARGLGGNHTDDVLEQLGGGLFAAPSQFDHSQGDFESTGNNLDVAIKGDGYFSVKDTKSNTQQLTRDGRFAMDTEGNLMLASANNQRVLDTAGKPIQVNPSIPVIIGQDGQITQAGQPIGQIGVFNVTDASQLSKAGGQMLNVADPKSLVAATNTTLHTQFLERSNVDPTTELTQLMDVQRQLEANANMIRYQDQMLDKLVNTVGRIG